MGDYFVDMRGMDLPAGYFPGSPSFAVDKDCKADRKTRCTLPVGATRSGRLLNYLYDDDWYRMPLKGGVSYRVTAAPEAGTGYSPKPMIHVLSPTGTELAKGVLGNATQDVQFMVPATGSYFLLVTTTSQTATTCTASRPAIPSASPALEASSRATAARTAALRHAESVSLASLSAGRPPTDRPASCGVAGGRSSVDLDAAGKETGRA